jgi:hypothetical protein
MLQLITQGQAAAVVLDLSKPLYKASNRFITSLLFSHSTAEGISVAQVMAGGLIRYLVPRLSRDAIAELEQL